MTGDVQLVGRRARPIVGLCAVGIEGIDELGTARLQLVGAAIRDPARELGFGARPLRRREAAGGVGAEYARDDFDVPQRRRSRRERLGGGGQARRQGRAVEPGAWGGLLGCDQVAPGVGPLPAEQISERGRRVAVAALEERGPPLQIGQRADREMVDLATDAFREGEHADQLGITRAGPRRPSQRIDRLGEEAMRDRERSV